MTCNLMISRKAFQSEIFFIFHALVQVAVLASRGAHLHDTLLISRPSPLPFSQLIRTPTRFNMGGFVVSSPVVSPQLRYPLLHYPR